MMQLRWHASVSASTFHATTALLAGQTLTDPRLSEALAEPAARLAQWVAGALGSDALGSDARQAMFFNHLRALAAEVESSHQLAERVLVRTLGEFRSPPLTQLAAVLGELVQAHVEVLPNIARELPLRVEPLRQQWEARGPGLLRQIGRLTVPRWLAERADVVLLHPVLGGGGAAHAAHNAVQIEALLANPWPELPEVARLGWLLAQLQFDQVALEEQVAPERLAELAAWAMLPVVLQAAEEVELARFDPPTLATAVRVWRLPSVEPAAATAALAAWWQAQQSAPSPWPEALAALDAQLPR